MLSLRSAQLLNSRRKLFGIIRQRCAAHLHVVACVPCVLHAFLWANEMSVCSKQSLICCSPISSMCNSDNPCHLHVCACDVWCVCFVCSLCTFLGVIFWSRPLWIEAFFSHLLLSCWLSKAGESKQTASTQQTEAVRPALLSWPRRVGAGGGAGGSGGLTPLYQAPSARTAWLERCLPSPLHLLQPPPPLCYILLFSPLFISLLPLSSLFHTPILSPPPSPLSSLLPHSPLSSISTHS